MKWLKKSPATAKYQTSQKKQQQKEQAKADGDDVDPVEAAKKELEKEFTIHEYRYFYPADLLKIPEFSFENKIEKGMLKPKDEAALTDYLAAKEEEIERKKAEEEATAQATSAGAGGAKGKADPKKDAKGAAKGGAKGGPAGDDKNCPQLITVDYPETPCDKNYIIYERQFDRNPAEAAALKRKPPRSAAPLVGKSSSSDPWGNMSEKFKDRAKELIS